MSYYLGTANYQCPYCGIEFQRRHYTDDPKRILLYCDDEIGGCGLQYVLSIKRHIDLTAVAMPIQDQIEEYDTQDRVISKSLDRFVRSFELRMIHDCVDVDDLQGVRLGTILEEFVNYVRKSSSEQYP
jgi:hypothetical protein